MIFDTVVFDKTGTFTEGEMELTGVGAIEAADVTLMRDDPVDVVKAIRISDATLQNINQNLVWALGYNMAMIPLVPLNLLQPVLAADAMAFSSVSVLANSLLFRRYTPDYDYKLLERFRWDAFRYSNRRLQSAIGGPRGGTFSPTGRMNVRRARLPRS